MRYFFMTTFGLLASSQLMSIIPNAPSGPIVKSQTLRTWEKSLASKMSHPLLHLVSKLLANGFPTQMLRPGQVLSSYILKPLRKDLASILSFIPSLLILGGQNLNECAQMLMSNLRMTSKRWQDDVWRPEARFWRPEAGLPPNIYFRN